MAGDVLERCRRVSIRLRSPYAIRGFGGTTLVSFLFDVAWSRAAVRDVGSGLSRYEDFDAFNASLDDDHDDIEIAGSTFLPSKVLYLLDATQYEAARLEWESDQSTVDNEEAAA
jgi:hypothetical protein